MLMFNDKSRKEMVPLKVLILGAEGSGKKTFAEELMKVEGFVRGDNIHVDVGPVVAEVLLNNGTVTHVFWIEAGHRVDKGDYPIECDPYRMIIVDNTLSLEHLKEEANYCKEMMGI